MDRVGFGRALGYGARHAAKALMQAADAAATPSNAPKTPAAAKSNAVPSPKPQEARPQHRPDVRAASATPPSATSARGRQAASRSFLHPIKRYSGAVLLQVVGTFFAVFALLMVQTVWKLRDGFHQPFRNPDAQHLWIALVLSAAFGWFAVSSFLRAGRLERS